MVLGLLMPGFPVALTFSRVCELTPEGIRREQDIDRSEPVSGTTGHKLNTLIVVLLVLPIGVVIADRLLPEAGVLTRPGPVTENAPTAPVAARSPPSPADT